jgi:hypothetical protein
MNRLLGRSGSPIAAIVAVVVLLATGCATGQGVANGTPAGTTLVPTSTTSASGTQSPTDVQSPSDGAVKLPTGSLVPGTTYFIDDPCCVGPARLFLTAPVGWETYDPIVIGKNALDDPGVGLYDVLLGAHLVGNVYTGGCHWQGTPLDPPVGPTVDDLATALVAQGGTGTGAPTDVTIGGYSGKKVELSIPADVDLTTCEKENGFPVFARWSPQGHPHGGAPWTYGSGQRNTVYIVDVDGTRQVIDTMYLPGTSAANLAELEQILSSIRFEP